MKRLSFYGFMISAMGIMAGISSCTSSEESENLSRGERHEPRQIELTQETRSTAQDLNDFYVRFTTDMVKYIDSENVENKNVIVSPLSAAMVLGMVANGIEDTPKKAITDYLGTDDTDALNSLCRILLTELPTTDNLTDLRLANSFWVNDDLNISLQDNFASTIKGMYGSETGSLNLSSDPANSIKEINSWCSRNTEGHIREFMENLDADMFAIALNAMYFNAPWDGSFFSPEKTKADTFHGASRDSEVMMMNMQERTTKYAANEYFEYFTLPFGNSSFNLRIMLPKEGISLEQAAHLVSGESLKQLMKGSKDVKLTLFFPKFKVEGKYNLTKMFRTTNLTPLLSDIKLTMFNPEKLGNIKFRHATSFSIDESGAEAAAVTSGEMYDSAILVTTPQESVTVRVDRPFFFFIDEFSTGACVIAGRIANL